MGAGNQLGKGLIDFLQCFADFIHRKIFQILFRIINGYFQLGDELFQLFPGFMYILRQGAGEVAFCLYQGGLSSGGDDIHDRFGLCQVDTSVQKSAFGEFALVGGNGAMAESQGKYGAQGFYRAVHLEFHHIFSCIGMRSFHVHSQSSVYDTVIIHDLAVIHHIGDGIVKIMKFLCFKHPVGDFRSVNTA